MDDDEIIRFTSSLPGVLTLTSSEAVGAPEMSWGDTFFYYATLDQPLPFATLVIHDYPGFDESSALDRPGVSRVNIAVGRSAFSRLIGYPLRTTTPMPPNSTTPHSTPCSPTRSTPP